MRLMEALRRIFARRERRQARPHRAPLSDESRAELLAVRQRQRAAVEQLALVGVLGTAPVAESERAALRLALEEDDWRRIGALDATIRAEREGRRAG